MSFPRIATTPLLVAGLLFSAHAAEAANITSASAAISNLHVTTIDLTPSDGVAAGLVATSFNRRLAASASYLPSYVKVPGTSGLIDTKGAQAESLNFSFIGGSGSSTQTGNFFESESTAVSSDVFAPKTGSLSNSTSQYSAWYQILPHTQLTISMHADATTSAPASGSTAYYANSWLHFEAVAVLGFGNRVQIGELDLNTQYAGNAQLGGDYTYTYSNNTDFNQQLYFNNIMFVSASHVVAAIPEPSTYAMLGVGLALLGVMRRRRA